MSFATGRLAGERQGKAERRSPRPALAAFFACSGSASAERTCALVAPPRSLARPCRAGGHISLIRQVAHRTRCRMAAECRRFLASWCPIWDGTPPLPAQLAHRRACGCRTADTFSRVRRGIAYAAIQRLSSASVHGCIPEEECWVGG